MNHQEHRTRMKLAEMFVGSWLAVDIKIYAEDGSLVRPLGERPNGFVTYDAAGNVSAMFSNPDVPTFTSEDRCQASADELHRAYHGFMGYFGTYEVDAARQTVTHRYTASSFPNDRGQAGTRHFRFSGDTLVLRTAPEPLDGLTFGIITLRRQPTLATTARPHTAPTRFPVPRPREVQRLLSEAADVHSR
jgi:hypothetical protein